MKKLPRIIFRKKKIRGKWYGMSFLIWIWLCTSAPYNTYCQVIRHEHTHYYQQRELLFIFAPFVWFILRIISTIKYGWKNAYKKHAWEAEAYANQPNENYLKNRKPFNWIKYI